MRQPFLDAGHAVRLAVRAGPGHLAADAAVTLVGAVVPVATVWLLKRALDAISGGGTADAATFAIAGLVAAGLLAATLPSLHTFLQNQVGRAVGRRAQSDLYQATARLGGLARLEDPEFHDRLRMAQSAGRSGPGQVVQGVLGTVQLGITVAGLVAVLAAVSPATAAVTLLGLAPALLAEIRLSRAQAAMIWSISPHERREFFYAELQTSLPAAKEVRLLGLSELFRLRMLDELAEADGQRRRLDARTLRVQFLLGLVSAAVLGAVLVWAVSLRRFSVGDISALVAGIAALQTTLAALVGRVSMVHNALLLYRHFRAVLDAEPDLAVPDEPQAVPPLRSSIEFRDVWFRYSPEQDWVLRGVNLVLPHGAAVGLVGLNGAGKSTMVKLLCRFYDPTRGAILWDGVDLRSLSLSGLRSRIGALFQDYMTYELTAAENIALGDVTASPSPADVEAAAARAGIDPVLRGLPHGYDTMLSKLFAEADGDGVLLSGGQWQRLALARTYLRDRRDLLILDEPSAGLDAEAEHEIHHGLRAHRTGATSLLISHRLGALRDADTIVVLSGGEIAERGRHAQLLAHGGEYARLFRLQADGYRPATEPVA
ncbi:ABC transporter ATP-binding protein [Dactylosporangium sp. NPDC000244]|uniref:ABC transporter ATP-binding protein n=1 Tax=Dactylosporangium sp. NPDC000244 TaxID=3154365 RepID=UPI003323AC7E